jgi:hypothetical protein
MTFQNKLSITLLSLAAILLYGVNIKAEASPKIVKLSPTITLTTTDKTVKGFQLVYANEINGGINNDLWINCKTKQYYYGLGSGNCTNCKPDIYSFTQTDSTLPFEDLSINYVCKIK